MAAIDANAMAMAFMVPDCVAAHRLAFKSYPERGCAPIGHRAVGLRLDNRTCDHAVSPLVASRHCSPIATGLCSASPGTNPDVEACDASDMDRTDRDWLDWLCGRDA